ncbi:MAG: helix-turn-helix transcriptional regulator [Polyangiaceae bacterium]
MAPKTSPFRGSSLLRKALACPTEPLNQAALALQLGVSQQAVSNWINGRSRPSAESMLELERLFAIDPREWLYRRTLGALGSAVKEVA